MYLFTELGVPANSLPLHPYFFYRVRVLFLFYAVFSTGSKKIYMQYFKKTLSKGVCKSFL